jgi:hypothetical protein
LPHRRCPSATFPLIAGDDRFTLEIPKMADHGEVQYATAEGNDYAEHEATYENFIAMTKWGVIFLIILLILMAYFLV